MNEKSSNNIKLWHIAKLKNGLKRALKPGTRISGLISKYDIRPTNVLSYMMKYMVGFCPGGFLSERVLSAIHIIIMYEVNLHIRRSRPD